MGDDELLKSPMEIWEDSKAPTPAWHDKPTGPGMWVCIGHGRMRGRDSVLNLTDLDLANGAPFFTEAVYGPIPER